MSRLNMTHIRGICTVSSDKYRICLKKQKEKELREKRKAAKALKQQKIEVMTYPVKTSTERTPLDKDGVVVLSDEVNMDEVPSSRE